MILTDREIQLALQKEQIIIAPSPDLECYASTSVDLRLGVNLNIFKKELTRPSPIETVIDPSVQGFNAERVIKQLSDVQEIGEEGYKLNPTVFVLGWTLEKVTLPSTARIAARIEGKSSLARMGLVVHFTAPTIHSGFNNFIRLEIINHGHVPIRLRRNTRICQLIFELTFGTPEKAFVAVQTS